MSERQARLRPAYQEWYPGVTTGVWHNAGWLTEKVLRQQRRGSPVWAIEGRPLSAEHFEFQGLGEPRRGCLKQRQPVTPR